MLGAVMTSIKKEVLMHSHHAQQLSRRRFLGGVTLAGMAGLLGAHPRPVAAEPPPETTRIRLLQFTSSCQAPLNLSEELLRTEGFTDVQWVSSDDGVVSQFLAAGTVDLGMNFVGPNLIGLEAGDPAMILAGGHVGCFELVGSDRVRSIRDLKGKTVAIRGLGGPEHVFLSAMAAYVGLDPQRDITWVRHVTADTVALFAEGKIDAFMPLAMMAQELRAKQIGHVVVNSAVDRPWSQYFCCMIIGHREFIRQHPVATKRAMRAILKTADLCALAPERAAQLLVDKGLAKQYAYALQLMQELPYGKWRDYNPEDTVRFYALRLHEAGMVKSSPEKLITQGTDWRFLTELKKELKG
jgi:NitT/TauT family transport system substrate-binding protein